MVRNEQNPGPISKRLDAGRFTGALHGRSGRALSVVAHTALPTVALIVALVAFLAGPMPASADPGPSPQDRTSVARGSSGSSGSSTTTSSGRTSVSRGSGGGGGAARTRPGGGGGGGRTTVHRPPRSGPGHRPGFHPRYYRSFFPYFGFSYFRYPYYLGYPYGYYGYPNVVWYDYQAYASMGGIDLNVRPKKAEVFIDGQRIGKVGRFDGYPSNLWLEEGTYQLVIYHPGYRTLHETVKVFAGVVIDFDQHMVPGEATPPEEIVPPPTVEPTEQVARDDPYREAPPSDMDLSHEPARLHLTVEPRDASVYLDGRFLGTGDELVDLRSGLMVNPGEHQLSVVRPSFESEELTVEVAPGEDLELAVRLHRTDGADGAR